MLVRHQRVLAAETAAAGGFVIRRRVVHDPADAVLRTREQLQTAIRDQHRLAKLRVPFRRAIGLVHETRRRREAGQRHVRRGIRWNGGGVNRDVEAAPLELARGGEADDARSHHRGATLGVRERHVRGHRAGAPRQRHARAAMPEVVNQCFRAEPVRFEDEAGWAMRAEADGRANHAIPRRIHHRQSDHRTPRRELRCRCGLRRAAFEPANPSAAMPPRCRTLRRFIATR